MHSQNQTAFSLAAFERYMLLDDQTPFSMTCHIRYWFDGVPDRKIFEQSLKNALMRHPLMSSLLIKRPKHVFFSERVFVPVPVDLKEVLSWYEHFSPQPSSTVSKNDMRVRFQIHTSENKSLLIIKFHHAISDGMGIFQFTEDLMTIYHNLMTGSQLPLRELETNLLHRRVNLGLSVFDWAKRLHLDLARFSRFFAKVPVTLRGTRKTSRRCISDAGAAVRTVLPMHALSKTLEAAQNYQTTLNELMISRLLKTCLDWNRSLGAHPNPWMPFRVNVPICLRTSAEQSMPAANYVSMVFLDRSPRMIDSEPKLVASIAKEMQQVKADRMGLTLIMAVTTMMHTKIFGPILRSGLCMTTTGLTNLGRPFRDFQLTGRDGLVRAGNLTMTGLDTLPPVRRKTLSTLSVNRYSNQLSITIRYDSTRWTQDDAQLFLELFTSKLCGENQALSMASPSFGLISLEPCSL